jgi:CRP-like cAMP-binding protein
MVDVAVQLTISNTSSQPSWNPLEDLAMLLHYDFMVHAFEAGTIVAIVAGAIGYFVVLRGSAFAAHALSHIGFAGATGAVVLSLNPIVGLLAFTLGSGVVIGALGNRVRGRDVTIGIVLAWTLGLGVLFISLYRGYATEAYALLFGQILGISGLMSGRPHDCTAVTRRPSVIGYVSKDDFMAAVDQQSGAWLAVLHLLSEDINVSYENLRAIAAHH